MYECLVGYTPFYADEPVQTCRKILRWQNFLEVPFSVECKLSPQCLSFLLSLLTDAAHRIGRNGVEEIMAHPWFTDTPWNSLHDLPAPYLPEGGEQMQAALTELRGLDTSLPTSSKRQEDLLSVITSNFDKFHDDGTLWSSSKPNVRKDKDHAFVDYTYKRKKDVVRTALDSLSYVDANSSCSSLNSDTSTPLASGGRDDQPKDDEKRKANNGEINQQSSVFTFSAGSVNAGNMNSLEKNQPTEGGNRGEGVVPGTE